MTILTLTVLKTYRFGSLQTRCRQFPPMHCITQRPIGNRRHRQDSGSEHRTLVMKDIHQPSSKVSFGVAQIRLQHIIGSSLICSIFDHGSDKISASAAVVLCFGQMEAHWLAQGTTRDTVMNFIHDVLGMKQQIFKAHHQSRTSIPQIIVLLIEICPQMRQ